MQWIPEQVVGILEYFHNQVDDDKVKTTLYKKAVMLDKMKIILKVRTQMVECIYKYFDLDLSESHRTKLYICTLLDPRFKKFNMRPTHKYVEKSQ